MDSVKCHESPDRTTQTKPKWGKLWYTTNEEYGGFLNVERTSLNKLKKKWKEEVKNTDENQNEAEETRDVDAILRELYGDHIYVLDTEGENSDDVESIDTSDNTENWKKYMRRFSEDTRGSGGQPTEGVSNTGGHMMSSEARRFLTSGYAKRFMKESRERFWDNMGTL